MEKDGPIHWINFEGSRKIFGPRTLATSASRRKQTSGSPTGPPHALQRKGQPRKLETGIILSTSDIEKTETLRRPESPRKDLRKEGIRDPLEDAMTPPRGSKPPAPLQDGERDHRDGKTKTSDKQTGKGKDKTKKDSPSMNPKRKKGHLVQVRKRRNFRRRQRKRGLKNTRWGKYYKCRATSTPSRRLITAIAHLRRIQEHPTRLPDQLRSYPRN